MMLPQKTFLWANPASFLFVFVLFKHKFYRKTVDVSGIGARIVGVEGEHADHLTTTTPEKKIVKGTSVIIVIIK